MASFIGTNKEFHRYIGPRLRNFVQQFTKSHKAEISACEHCGSKGSLESAHVHGRERYEIINLILNENTHNSIVTIDIAKFETRFKEEHQPLEKSILILCRDCHKKYDFKAPYITSTKNESSKSNEQSHETVNNKGYLPITLEPSDPETFKQELLQTQKATIETSFSDGRIVSKPWNVSRFSISSNVLGNLRSRSEYRSGNWQSNGIVKVHVKVVKNA